MNCGVFTGILFSRKPCAQPAATTCGRCATPLCNQHVRPQMQGRFLCPSCDAYENDDHWRYSDNDRSWHYRSSSSSGAAGERHLAAGAAGAAAGVAAGDLADEDKAGLSTNAAGAWHGPDDAADAADGADHALDADGGGDAEDSDSDTDDDGGFDAS